MSETTLLKCPRCGQNTMRPYNEPGKPPHSYSCQYGRLPNGDLCYNYISKADDSRMGDLRSANPEVEL